MRGRPLFDGNSRKKPGEINSSNSPLKPFLFPRLFSAISPDFRPDSFLPPLPHDNAPFRHFAEFSSIFPSWLRLFPTLVSSAPGVKSEGFYTEFRRNQWKNGVLSLEIKKCIFPPYRSLVHVFERRAATAAAAVTARAATARRSRVLWRRRAANKAAAWSRVRRAGARRKGAAMEGPARRPKPTKTFNIYYGY